MNVETYKIISTVGFILAAVMLILVVILFFKFNILKVFGDITGKTAKKAIQSIREQNVQSGNKPYKSSPVNIRKGKTEKMSNSSKLNKQNDIPISINEGTERNHTQKLVEQNVTTVLSCDSVNTTVLYVTESLDGMTNVNMPKEEIKQQANLELDITFLHTDEVIL
jgi:hypothetical protein